MLITIDTTDEHDVNTVACCVNTIDGAQRPLAEVAELLRSALGPKPEHVLSADCWCDPTVEKMGPE